MDDLKIEYIMKFHEDFLEPIKEGIKKSTIRADSKPLKTNDICYGYFHGIDKAIGIKITDHYAKKLCDLNKEDAKNEGYLHENLLKHELKNIYPDLSDEDYVYIYKFEGISDELIEKVNDPSVKKILDDFRAEIKTKKEEEL